MNTKSNGPACLAPPLTDELLVQYKTLAESASPEIKEAMVTLLNCCLKWWDLPESTTASGQVVNAANGKGTKVVSLADDIKQSLDQDIPWTRELNGMGELFDSIDPVSQRDLRNAAYHLLWHVKELDADREPLTHDKLV